MKLTYTASQLKARFRSDDMLTFDEEIKGINVAMRKADRFPIFISYNISSSVATELNKNGFIIERGTSKGNAPMTIITVEIF